jgi:gas vesicle structural protein
MAVTSSSNRYISAPAPSGLADVVDLILDKGLVIDLYVRVSLVGIELLTIDARIVVASVDTYLRFAEAVGRMNIAESDEKEGLPDLMQDLTQGASKHKAKGALDAAKDKFDEMLHSDDDEDGSRRREPDAAEQRPRRRSRRRESEE